MNTVATVLAAAWVNLSALWQAAGAANNDQIVFGAADFGEPQAVEFVVRATGTAPPAGSRGHLLCGGDKVRHQLKTANNQVKIYARAYYGASGGRATVVASEGLTI